MKITFEVEINPSGAQEYYKAYPELFKLDSKQGSYYLEALLAREAIAGWELEDLTTGRCKVTVKAIEYVEQEVELNMEVRND